MILEIALVKYKENGDYDYTIENEYLEFKTKEETYEYIKTHKEEEKNRKEKNIGVELYLYESEKDVEENNQFDCIIL